ncbi:MAG: right-handed parallel beta-helix repeat-containing protein, partial [Thermoplasmata archaeon]|nr:right-handed parallel beta-helix repeat-containing protein [Thermoplasmata archaeon]
NNTNIIAIYLDNCSSALIDYNTLSELNSMYGIVLNGMDLSSDVYITNNTLQNNIEIAIGINNTGGTGDIYVKDNNIYSTVMAIGLSDNDAGTFYVSDNTIDTATLGLGLDNATSPVIDNNDITNCEFGMNLTWLDGNPELTYNDLSSITKVGMTLSYFHNFTLENNTFLDIGWESIRAFNFDGNLMVKNNDFDNGIWGGIWAYNTANSSTIKILTNDFTDTWTPIYIEGDSDDVLIQENTLVDCIDGGIWIGKTDDDAADTVTIDNNDITGTIDGAWGTGDAIYLEAVNTILIKNNDILDGENNGISINTDGWAWQSITIEDNLIKDNAGDGIYSTDSAFSPSNYVINNTFLNNGNYGFYSTYSIPSWTFNDTTTFSGNSIYMGTTNFDLIVGVGGNLTLNDFN